MWDKGTNLGGVYVGTWDLTNLAELGEPRRLWIGGLGRSRRRDPTDDNLLAPPEPPEYQLEQLMLSHEYLSSAQFQYLISSPTMSSRLPHLNLEKVRGISPETLSIFLSSVSSTLKTLRLVDCDEIVIRTDS